MIHRTFEEDGNQVTELDLEAIDYLIEGLEELRDMEAGQELSTPSIEHNEEEGLVGVGEFILRRAAEG